MSFTDKLDLYWVRWSPEDEKNLHFLPFPQILPFSEQSLMSKQCSGDGKELRCSWEGLGLKTSQGSQSLIVHSDSLEAKGERDATQTSQVHQSSKVTGYFRLLVHDPLYNKMLILKPKYGCKEQERECSYFLAGLVTARGARLRKETRVLCYSREDRKPGVGEFAAGVLGFTGSLCAWRRHRWA